MRPIVIQSHTRPIMCARFNKDGDLFFLGSKDGKVSVFWTRPVERLGTYDCNKAVSALAVSEDSTLLLVGNMDNEVLLFRVETGEKLASKSFEGIVKHVEFSMGCRQFLVITSNPGSRTKPAHLLVFNTDDFRNKESFQPVLTISTQTDKFTTATWGYLNQTIYCGTENGKIAYYDARSSEMIHSEQVHSGLVTNLRFNRDYSILLSTSKDTTAKLLNCESLAVVKTFSALRPINSGVISPLMYPTEGRKYHVLLAGGQDAREVTTTSAESGMFEVSFFNMVEEALVGTVKGHFGPVHCIDVSPDGRCFITGSEDGQARMHMLDDDYFTEDFD